MEHLPISVVVRGRPALVVGGGGAAARKAQLLARAGARVSVVAPRPGEEVAAMARGGAATLHERPFEAADLAGQALVFAADGDAAADAAVADAARAAGIPVNIVDGAAGSTFVMPAIVDRDGIVVAIATGGAAPALARRVRAMIEAALPPRLGALARFAQRFRGAAAAVIPGASARRRFWDAVFAGPVADAVLAGDEPRAAEAMLSLLNGRGHHARPGRVAVVSVPDGEADLLTLRALRLLNEADAVVHDPGLDAALEMARRDAERIPVGPGEDDVAPLARHAARGGLAVRLVTADAEAVRSRLAHRLPRGLSVAAVPAATAAAEPLAATG